MSVVYAVTCKCGADLGFKCFLDSDEDLAIDVDECEDCKERNSNNGYEDGYEKGKADGLVEAEAEE